MNKEELQTYLMGLKVGEKVAETELCNSRFGCIGEVYISEGGLIRVLWHLPNCRVSQMGTSVTGGTRRLEDALVVLRRQLDNTWGDKQSRRIRVALRVLKELTTKGLTGTTTDMKPIGNKISIKLDKRETHKGGIIVPERYQATANEGEVIAVGKDCTKVVAGDRVGIQSHIGTHIKLRGDSFIVIEEDKVSYKILPKEAEYEGAQDYATKA